MRRFSLFLIVGCIAVVQLLVAADVPEAQKPKADTTSDTSSIRWFLPGQFDKARAAAKARNRLLVLKGISFGIDAKGATCATAGSW